MVFELWNHCVGYKISSCNPENVVHVHHQAIVYRKARFVNCGPRVGWETNARPQSYEPLPSKVVHILEVSWSTSEAKFSVAQEVAVEKSTGLVMGWKF